MLRRVGSERMADHPRSVSNPGRAAFAVHTRTAGQRSEERPTVRQQVRQDQQCNFSAWHERFASRR